MIHIRNVKKEDLSALVELEQRCFLKEEAATEEAFIKRIESISDSFFVAEEDGVIVGLVNGPVIGNAFITDDLFHEIQANPAIGGHQSVLGLAVSPDYQEKGIASALLAHLEKVAKEKHRKSVTLTCKQNLIRFYEKHGFINQGISASGHGGNTWYNMVKILN